jgi:DNA-binding transcriptional MerR regulator
LVQVSEQAQTEAPTYRIGAVSRLTGIPADTLRVWERRYGVADPFRSDAGTRLYGAEDLGRLTLIKRLVDRGDAIGSVARLSLAQLRERLSGADLPDPAQTRQRPCRVAVLGAALCDRLRRESAGLDGLELVGLFEREDELLDGLGGAPADLVLLEYPSLQPDQVPEICQLLARSGIGRAILIYGFATQATLERLAARRILAKRAPVEIAELRRCCLALGPHSAQRRPDESGAAADPDLALPIPPRRYDAARLARIAAASPAVRCECPRHLSDLIAALGAFESYCEGCESRHPDDAALHAYLHASTARARSLMETALARLLAAEGMDPGHQGEGSTL